MSGDKSFGYCSQNISHSFSHFRNDDGISSDESCGVSEGDGRHGYMYQETRHYSSLNFVVYHIDY